MIPRTSSKASPVKAITRITSSTLSLWKNIKIVWIIHLPEKKGRPRCYAKSTTVQDVFQPISAGVCGEWGMRNAISCTITVRRLALSSMQQVIWTYKLTFLYVLCLKWRNDHTVCTLHFYPCSQAQSREEEDSGWVQWLVKTELTHMSAIGWGRDSQRTQEGWRREREEEEVFSPSGSLLPLKKM